MIPILKRILSKKKQADTFQHRSLSVKERQSNQSLNPVQDVAYFGKLVVVGNESIFSPDLMDYALEMAQRMSYEIVALNTAPLSCETFKLFSSSRRQVCNEFQQLAEKNVTAFKDKVTALNIPFLHVVKFCDTDQAIEELRKEIGEIDFIASDAQTPNEFEITMDQEVPRCSVFVYAVN